MGTQSILLSLSPLSASGSSTNRYRFSISQIWGKCNVSYSFPVNPLGPSAAVFAAAGDQNRSWRPKLQQASHSADVEPVSMVFIFQTAGPKWPESDFYPHMYTRSDCLMSV